MTKKRRTTPQNAAVFRYLYGATGNSYGDEIADALKISRSTVYAALKRLEADGLADSQRELMGARELGRPRRTYYRLSAKGRAYGDQLPAADPPAVLEAMR